MASEFGGIVVMSSIPGLGIVYLQSVETVDK